MSLETVIVSVGAALVSMLMGLVAWFSRDKLSSIERAIQANTERQEKGFSKLGDTDAALWRELGKTQERVSMVEKDLNGIGRKLRQGKGEPDDER